VNENSALPLGTFASFWYRDMSATFALPIAAGSATKAPAGESLEPDTEPPSGSVNLTD